LTPVLDAGIVTEDAVLGGRLRLLQPKDGHRVGHDAILLAAACPAFSGERVVDLGAGVGAAGLAVALRVPGVEVALVDLDEQVCALARENARINGLADSVFIAQLDVTGAPATFAAAGLQSESIARVLLNPPFNDPRRQRPSPDLRRRLAHSATPGGLSVWIGTAKRLLRPGGTLTLISRADALDAVLCALQSLGAVAVLPVHSHPGQPAIRILVRATKSSRAPMIILPGFYLNDAAGRPSMEAQSLLRGEGTLALAQL
jgi:tRNA1(Val) A37 N6-methylase TrmN6